MYDLQAQHWAPCQLLTGCLYRVDSRPPADVMQNGFTGTQGQSHSFAAFEEHTVFASLSIEGALAFQRYMLNLNVRLPYLYRINATGLRGYIFRSRHCNENTYPAARQLATVRFERFRHFYVTNRAYAQLGESRFIHGLALALRYRIHNAHTRVNEVHLYGPVTPARITPCYAHTFEDVPAPVATLAPRCRRNSI